jgi:hypothetical protein
MPNPLIKLTVVSTAAWLAIAMGSAANANEPSLKLQGLFCNTQQQIDDALTHIDHGLSPRAAAHVMNKDQIICTYVDRLQYVVTHPIRIGAHRGRLSLVKYEADLTGVIVGDQLRPIVPTLRIFFITPEPLAEASLEERS